MFWTALAFIVLAGACFLASMLLTPWYAKDGGRHKRDWPLLMFLAGAASVMCGLALAFVGGLRWLFG